ncbi:MAG TPA: succinylglutamate desuccinylase/aspartoacylase family protein [Nitrososphaera sp.]|nr:succinylglutamate desuccinylase/aspartoacylase family protein [Nitrososphaera sp.]
MKRILLIGSQHGNELLGEVLQAYIHKNHRELLPYITHVTGNIKAKKAGVRFIESDLNRSYTGGRKTYEERRANKLLQLIKKGQFDLVLDLHTTTNTHIQPCLIIPSVNESIRPFLSASSIERLVLMRHPMVETSLIGSCPTAVSIEVSYRDLDDKLMSRLTSDISNFLANNFVAKKRTVYEVSQLLAKGELDSGQIRKLRNFEKSEHGFTPVLVGDNAYKKHTKYLGFKADKVYETEL